MIRNLLLAAVAFATFAAAVPTTAQDRDRGDRGGRFGERYERDEGRRWRPHHRPNGYHPGVHGSDRRYYGRHDRRPYYYNGRHYRDRYRYHGGWRYR